LVTVVAFLPKASDAITASRCPAVVGAIITFDLVAVVALLVVLVADP